MKKLSRSWLFALVVAWVCLCATVMAAQFAASLPGFATRSSSPPTSWIYDRYNNLIGSGSPAGVDTYFTTVSSNTTPVTVTSGFGWATAASAVIVGNSNFAFSITTSGAAQTGVIALPQAPNAWSCQANDITNAASYDITQTASTTTSATFTSYSKTAGTALNWTAGDTIYFQCASF